MNGSRRLTIPGQGQPAETVQGLLIHQHIAPAYGVTLGPDQQATHVRAAEKILGDIVTRDSRVAGDGSG